MPSLLCEDVWTFFQLPPVSTTQILRKTLNCKYSLCFQEKKKREFRVVPWFKKNTIEFYEVVLATLGSERMDQRRGECGCWLCSVCLRVKPLSICKPREQEALTFASAFPRGYLVSLLPSVCMPDSGSNSKKHLSMNLYCCEPTFIFLIKNRNTQSRNLQSFTIMFQIIVPQRCETKLPQQHSEKPRILSILYHL